MPPKRGRAAASAATPSEPIYGTCGANEETLNKHQAQIDIDLAKIMEQDGCSDILQRAGVSPAQAPFDPEMFNNAMAEFGPGYYRCGGNGLWASSKCGPVAPHKNKLEELIN